ncbi:methenyltetrahydromethanopterin cyclohydrolase [Dethiosulfatarculus sandiegensis]|uniref:methenyltetrahydromethanopterin cyclohydrolase n=1 Tax=Dethiosulfatarculus sandiegensis TaxID=1429043 RepID=UPI0005C95A18|nr:methenyltetrahydromethanopterin cyclohydrolase [Dethiosulfatarculus sandiegensis]
MSLNNLNQRALDALRPLLDDPAGYGVELHKTESKATIIDAGVNTPGSLEAGRIMAEVCLAGLARVEFTDLEINGKSLLGVAVTVAHPKLACMAAQYAGWAFKARDPEGADSYFAMGSGPARAAYAGEEIYAKLNYREDAQVAVLVLETGALPPDWACVKAAEKCGVAPENLYLLTAPTASLAGSVQVAGRIVETGMHKMFELGFDLDKVIAGFGVCPVAPVAKNDLRAIGRTNDAVLYGGKAWYTVKAQDSELEELLPNLPSSSSADYGTSFYQLFKRYDGDFYKIDPMLFSPAQVMVNNLESGRSFEAGKVDMTPVMEEYLS